MKNSTNEQKLENPGEILALIKARFSEVGIQVKASTKDRLLTLALGSTKAPPKADCLKTIRQQLQDRELSGFRAVQVRGYQKGIASPVWIERISTDTLVTPSKKAHKQTKLSQIQTLLKNRATERGVIASGTFLLTSLLWLGVGAIDLSHQASSDSTQPTFSLVKPSSHTLTGSFTLIDSDLGGSDDNCYGTGGYDDITSSMPVTVRDGAGKILAVGSTKTGKAPKGMDFLIQCEFDFQVDEVPRSDFYSVEVGRRGELNYSFQEMEEQNWTVSLSLS